MTDLLKRIYLLSSVGLLLICLIPFLALSFYCQLQADDFIIGYVAEKNGFFTAQMKWYLEWSGRFTAHSLISLLLSMVYGSLKGLGIIALAIQFVFLGSVWYFLSSVLRKVELANRLFLFSLAVLSYYWLMPAPAEAFYWITGAFSYQIGACLNLLLFGVLIRNEYQTQSLTKIFMILLAIAIPGTCEMDMLILLSGLGSLILWRLINREKLNNFVYIIAAVAFCFAIGSVMSPGNSARTEVMNGLSIGHPGEIGFTTKAGIQIVKQQLVQFAMKTPLLLFSVLFIIGISTSGWVPQQRPKAMTILMFSFVFFVCYYALHLPFPYKSGVLLMPGRVLNVTNLFFLAGWFTLLTLGWFYFAGIKQLSISPVLPAAASLFILAYCLFQLLLPNKIQNAWRDLLTGTASRYDSEIHARYSVLSSHRKKQDEVSLPPLENLPHTIFLTDLDTSASDWRNVSVALYFEVDSIRIDSTLNPLTNR